MKFTKSQTYQTFAMDVDGILSDGQIIYNSEGTETKAFYVQDGLVCKHSNNQALF